MKFFVLCNVNMRSNLHKLFALFALFFCLESELFAQAPPLTVPNYSACPCQTITFTPTWNNVSNITYTLFSPGLPPQPFAGSSYTLFNCTQTFSTITYTLAASGTYTGSPITSSTPLILSITPPSAMTLTNGANNGNYCFGDNATIIAPVGGASYFVGTPVNLTSLSNVITLGAPITPGNYTVTSVINGCTVTGVTTMDISPNVNVTINTPSSVCQGTGCVNLTANLATGTNYQWYDNFNTLMPGATGSSTQICNLAINQGGTYKVTVDQQFNGILCPHVATTTINVVPRNPVSAAASPASILCQGTSLNLSANAAGATGYSWVGPQAFSSNASNPSINPLIPANGGVYTVTAFFVSSLLTCNTVNTVSVQVVAMASPIISMPSSTCQSQNGNGGIVISATAAVVPLSYSWSGPAFPGGSASGASVPVPTPQPNNSGTQFVTANFGNGCVSTSSAQLNVVPVNTVTVIPPGPICSPTNAFLQALATGANLYTWVGPNGFSTPGANVYVYYPTPAASGVYTVTAYFGSGTGLVCSNNNTLSLNVYPVLQFSLVPRQEACYNTPITISGPAGASSYSWTSSTGFTSNNKDIFIPNALPNNSGTYTLNVSLGPCKSAASSEVVILNPISFTLTPQNRTICSGDTIILEGGASGGSQNYAYVWNPAIYLGSNTGAQQTAVPLGSVQYNLNVHDIACPNYTISHAFEVNVNQPPQPKITLPLNQGCQPLCMFYNTGTQNEAFTTTYDFGRTLVFQKDSFNYCLNEPGTYTLNIYSKGKNGCSGKYQYPFPLIVRPSPGSDFTWIPEEPSTIDEVVFVPSAKNGPVVHRTWTFIGGVSPGDTSNLISSDAADTTNIEQPTRFYDKFDTYPVLLVTNNESECQDSVVKYVKVIDNFQLFVPNTFTPNEDGVNDIFMMKGTGVKSDNFSMEIFNRAGLIVFSTKNINEGWDGKVKGQLAKDAVYVYKIKAVGMNGEGRKEFTGYVTLLK